MAEKEPFTDVPRSSIASELRLVLVGPPGAGKSATGNTILGRRVFDDNMRGRPTSLDNQCHFANNVVDGQNVLVVDTPGLLYDNDSSENLQEEISREIAKTVLLSAPGPHAILLTISIGMSRVSNSMQYATRFIEDMFGKEAKSYIIIILTGLDDLEQEEVTLDDYIATVPSYMSAIFKKYPVFAINNASDSDNKQRQTKGLLKIVTENNNVPMSNALYEGIEEILQRAGGESLL